MRASILILAALISGAADAHPFDSAIDSLAKAAADLDASARSNKISELTQKGNEIRLRASALWLEAAVAPIVLGDEKMKRLGFFLATVNGGPAEFYIAKSEAAERATQEIMELNASRWLELGRLIRKQQSDIKELIAIVDKREQLTGIEEKDRKLANYQTMRGTALNQFREFVEQASDCAQYFKRSIQSFGLAAEKSGRDYVWSPAELKRVYDSESLEEMTAEQKEQIRGYVEEISAKAIQYDHACISVEQSAFYASELKKLGKKK